MPFYVAIDGGGTHTRALLADSNRILARASTGTVKLMRVAEAEATERLRALLTELAGQGGVPLAHVSRACFGLAGSSSESVRDWAHRALDGFVGGTLEVCGDVDILLDAAFPGAPGIVVIAGTGSNCVGRDASGQLHTAGGWGPVLGDEGSGFWIGLEAVRGALRAQDRLSVGGVSTCLLREIEAHWNLTSTGELIALGNLRAPSRAGKPPDFAALAPTVARCAAEGDAIAAGVLERAGEQLAELVTLVFRKMSSAATEIEGAGSRALDGGFEVAFTGSVLEHIAAVRETMEARLKISAPAARVRRMPVDPIEGALYRAKRG